MGKDISPREHEDVLIFSPHKYSRNYDIPSVDESESGWASSHHHHRRHRWEGKFSSRRKCWLIDNNPATWRYLIPCRQALFFVVSNILIGYSNIYSVAGRERESRSRWRRWWVCCERWMRFNMEKHSKYFEMTISSSIITSFNITILSSRYLKSNVKKRQDHFNLTQQGV